LFNNAGIAIEGETRYLTMGHWRRVLDVHLYGVLHGTVAAYPIMVKQGFGHIVNTSSAAAFTPVPANAPYGTAKHAVLGLSRSLRLEGADLGVKVSCVCPGFVRTNVFQNTISIGPNPPGGAAREQSADASAKMMPAAQAAQVILDGVARNQGLIVFPASIRWVRHVYQVFPGLIERELLRQLRRRRLPKIRQASALKPAFSMRKPRPS
jgi:short-subunit dehydrogenase